MSPTYSPLRWLNHARGAIPASLGILTLFASHPASSAWSTNECASCSAEQDPRPLPQTTSSLPRVHDPVIAKEGDTYYVFSTGRGLTLHSSKDAKTWTRVGRIFDSAMPWTRATIPGSTDYYWAPDISYSDGTWRLYYSVSTFGKNRSAIGLATNTTLDPAKPGYAWKDEGSVIESQPTDDYNAIDPNVIQDGKDLWLAFGSFWSGIKMVRLDPSTGKPAEGRPKVISLATRPRGEPLRGAVEAPFMYRHGRFHYLFVSFDFCCRGVNSTYNIRVGRSEKVTGPYVDRDGKPMLDGGGTLLLEGEGRWKGPGHNAVFRNGREEWLVYHAYDAEDNGASKLQIRRLEWDKDGWPRVAAPGPTIVQ
jgi:arabinan endo-1,5-alpha-L-arabinosidase